jgi:KaiC/GvpD/RAD55 family RecA-like ATPase
MRTPERLLSQANRFLMNLGNAQALGQILLIDPFFRRYLKEECGLNDEAVVKMSEFAEQAANSLKNEDGIVTVESMKAWLAKQDPKEDTVFPECESNGAFSE